MVNPVINPHSLPLDALVKQCAQQTDLFRRGRESDTSFCFEIFRRAILEKDQDAWGCIHNVYSEQIIRWVHRHPSFSSTGEEAEYFVNRALEKLWQAIPSERFELFPDLKHLLSYLQLCVHSVITDHLRGEMISTLLVEESEAFEIPEPTTVEERVEDRSQAHALWIMFTSYLRDLKDVRVAYDSFVLGLKPNEILERAPSMFKNAREIYRTKENILERMHSNPDLIKQFRIMVESDD